MKMEEELETVEVNDVFRETSIRHGCAYYLPTVQPVEIKGTLLIDIPINQDIPRSSHRGRICRTFPNVLESIWQDKLPLGKIAYFSKESLNSENHDLLVMISKTRWHDYPAEVRYVHMLMEIARVIPTFEIERLITTAPPIMKLRFPVVNYLRELDRIFGHTGTKVIVCKGD